MIAQSIQRSVERSFGTACFLAYFALLFFRHTAEMVGSYLPYAALAGVLFVAVFAGSAHQADRLDRLGPARLSALASILCAAGVFLLEALPTPLLFVFGGVLSLMGCAAFFLIYGKNLAFYNHQERICQLATAFVVGAAIVALTATLADTVAFLVTLFLPLFAALHLFTLKPNKDTFAFASLAETSKSHQFALSSLFTTALTGFVWGIAFCLLAVRSPAAEAAPLCFALPIAVGGLVFLVDLFTGKKLSESSLLRCFATVAFLAIAPLPFVPGWVQQLCGAFLFMTFSLDTLVCFSAMGEVARFNQISPYWVFGTSLAYYFSGAFVGFLGFGWAFSFGTQLPQLIACFLSLLLIVWCSNYVFQDSYPCSESIADMVEASRSLSMNESRPALWQRKIDRVIEQFELTTRQQEVFRMLVRGRNAQYIAEKFFISISTAKAHIHNIYRKLDVHSQQELINLVENVEMSAAPVPASDDQG